MTWTDLIGAGSVVAAAAGVFVSWKALGVARETANIGKSAADSAENVAKVQRMLTQRQFLIPLWQYMTSVNAIDTQHPHIDDVRAAVHTLELVALCVEGGMVDEAIIKRTFREPFVALYDQIASCPYMDPLKRDGKALLRENRAAMAFYQQLVQELQDQDKPPPLQSGKTKKQLKEGKK